MLNDYKIVGTHTMRAGVPEDCIECHSAEWGGVLVNGVCGRCLYAAWQNAQQSVQPTVLRCAPAEHDFSKGLECAKCGELLF